MEEQRSSVMPFEEAVNFVNQHKTDLTDRDRGLLYGLYKRAQGSAPEKMKEPHTQKDLLQTVRWALWKRYEHITPEQAKWHYGHQVAQIKDRLDKRNS